MTQTWQTWLGTQMTKKNTARNFCTTGSGGDWSSQSCGTCWAAKSESLDESKYSNRLLWDSSNILRLKTLRAGGLRHYWGLVSLEASTRLQPLSFFNREKEAEREKAAADEPLATFSAFTWRSFNWTPRLTERATSAPKLDYSWPGFARISA